MAIQTTSFDFAGEKDGVFVFVAGREIPVTPVAIVGYRRLEWLALILKEEAAGMRTGADVVRKIFRTLYDAAVGHFLLIGQLRNDTVPGH